MSFRGRGGGGGRGRGGGGFGGRGGRGTIEIVYTGTIIKLYFLDSI